MNESIRALRGATRQLVRELKIVEGNGFLEGMRLSECHVLYEIGRRGETTASELADAMLLEKSRISRLVKSLERRGTVTGRIAPDDRRQRLLTLTDAGRRAMAEIDRIADSQVASAFAYLTEEEQRTAIDALARYGKALRYARAGVQFNIRTIQPEDNPAVAAIIRETMTEFGAVGCGYSIEDPEVDAMFESYSKPRSRYWVIERADRVLGGGGIGPLQGGDEETCELQKMYFLPELRGHGLGVPLIRRCLESAREFGYRRCYLETLDHMHQARQLYRRMGFVDRDAPMGETGHYRCNSWMELDLRAGHA